MKQISVSIALLVLAMVLLACAATPAPMSAPPRPLGTAAPAGAPVASDGQSSAKGTTAANAASEERMIVYTVRLNLEVQDADKASNDITAIASQYKGYVSASNLSRDSKGRLRGTITLRIPAQSLDAAQKQIEGTALKVLTRNRDSRDVTDQYADLGAQLKNLEATEVELNKLLVTVREKTGKAEDILAVYNKLIEIRTRIEQIKGQMNVLDRTTTYATMTIELTPREEVQIVEPETWLPNKTAAQALKALIQGLQGILDLAIWALLFFLPIGIVLILPFVIIALILRALMRRRKKPVVTS
jgi:hypothetical protein